MEHSYRHADALALLDRWLERHPVPELTIEDTAKNTPLLLKLRVLYASLRPGPEGAFWSARSRLLQAAPALAVLSG